MAPFKILCIFFFYFLADQVDTFKWVNVAFLATLKTATTIIQLRNTFSTTPYPWNQMFTPYIPQWYLQHLILNQPSLQFQLFGWLSRHFQIFEYGATYLIERYASPLPSSSGLRQRWCRICFGEVTKGTNPSSLD
jgi:hypothetical protein